MKLLNTVSFSKVFILRLGLLCNFEYYHTHTCLKLAFRWSVLMHKGYYCNHSFRINDCTAVHIF